MIIDGVSPLFGLLFWLFLGTLIVLQASWRGNR